MDLPPVIWTIDKDDVFNHMNIMLDVILIEYSIDFIEKYYYTYEVDTIYRNLGLPWLYIKEHDFLTWYFNTLCVNNFERKAKK